MPLTDTSIRTIRPSDKVQKFSDGGGLYLHVSPAGGKLWRMAYRFEGKQKTLSFGAYPAVGLKEARSRREEAKRMLANGLDPGSEKRRLKVQAALEEREKSLTFEVVEREWYAKKTGNLSEGYRKQILSRLERHLFPYIGAKPIARLEPADIVLAVRHTEERGAVEMAHRMRADIERFLEEGGEA